MGKQIITKLGAAIKAKREELGINQVTMAADLGYLQSTYAGKEPNGRFKPQELKVIAKYLKMDLNDLLAESAKDVIIIEDVLEHLTIASIKAESVHEVLLSAMAELLSDKRKRNKESGSVNTLEVLKQLTEAVNQSSKRRIDGRTHS